MKRLLPSPPLSATLFVVWLLLHQSVDATTLLSAALLGEMPQGYHAVAFILIAAGIVWSSRRG